MVRIKRLFSWAILPLLLASVLSCSKEGGKAVDGNKAPDFSLSDVYGKTVTMSELKDKVVMLEFWATWCPPCRQSVPELNAIYEKYKDKGFVLLAVSLDKGSDAKSGVISFMKDYSITYPVLIDNGKVSQKYSVSSIPTSFIIDRKGRIAGRHIGYSSGSAAAISGEIEALL